MKIYKQIACLGLVVGLSGCATPSVNLYYKELAGNKIVKSHSNKTIAVTATQNARENPDFIMTDRQTNYVGAIGIPVDKEYTYFSRPSLASHFTSALNTSLQKAGYKIVNQDSDRKISATILNFKCDKQTPVFSADYVVCKLWVDFNLSHDGKTLWQETLKGQGEAKATTRITAYINDSLADAINGATNDLIHQLLQQKNL